MKSLAIGLSLLLVISVPVVSLAVEPVTVSELGKALSTDIGNLYVELRATQIYASKLQAEVDKLTEAAKPKVEEEKKK